MKVILGVQLSWYQLTHVNCVLEDTGLGYHNFDVGLLQTTHRFIFNEFMLTGLLIHRNGFHITMCFILLVSLTAARYFQVTLASLVHCYTYVIDVCNAKRSSFELPVLDNQRTI